MSSSVQDVAVEHLIDLDALAERLNPVIKKWDHVAQVGPFTWRDENAPWPQPIVTNRSALDLPESLGIRIRREPDDELDIVVWTGGWADVDSMVDDVVTSVCPEFRDLDEAYAAVVQHVEDFLD